MGPDIRKFKYEEKCKTTPTNYTLHLIPYISLIFLLFYPSCSCFCLSSSDITSML